MSSIIKPCKMTKAISSRIGTILIEAYILTSALNVIFTNGNSITFEQKVVIIQDNVSLDCHVKNETIFPVYWSKGNDEHIAVKESSEIRSEPYTYTSSINRPDPKHSVSYDNHSGEWLFSLNISGVEPSDAGEYKCLYFDEYPHGNVVILQTYQVSIAWCRCRLPEGLTNFTGDTNVTVNCTFLPLGGYQSSKDINTTISISPGSRTVKGNLQGSYFTTSLLTNLLCKNIFLEFELNPNLLFKMQCPVPQLNPCPYITYTPTFQPTTMNTLQIQTTGTRHECFTLATVIKKALLVIGVPVVIVVLVILLVVYVWKKRDQLSSGKVV